jgi:hypothetical protein
VGNLCGSSGFDSGKTPDRVKTSKGAPEARPGLSIASTRGEIDIAVAALGT